MTTTLPSTKNVLRLLYDFDSNTWAPEFHKREFRFQVMHNMNGYIKPYFQDETGRVWRDETGNTDGADTIPFEVEFGTELDNSPLKKNIVGIIVSTENARGAQIMLSVDKREFKDIGQVTEDLTEIYYKAGTNGRITNYKIRHNDAGDAPVLDGIITFTSQEELFFGDL
jgi:hypothetical protein